MDFWHKQKINLCCVKPPDFYVNLFLQHSSAYPSMVNGSFKLVDTKTMQKVLSVYMEKWVQKILNSVFTDITDQNDI